MRIAFLSAYVGKEYSRRYCEGKQYALSGSLKTLGIARALMLAGHDVTIFSSGLTIASTIIKPFTETEEYPEGTLKVQYGYCCSYPRCSPINEFMTSLKLRMVADDFDVFIYYNITLGAALSIGAFKRATKIIEYEDNVFNKALRGNKIKMLRYKVALFNYLISNTDAVLAVCLGLQLKDKLKYSLLTPGIVNDDVINNISTRINRLNPSEPVKIILTGGIHYSKGGDILIKSMSYIKTPCIVSVYGNCEFTEDLRELIKSIPERHKFYFKGYMKHADLIKTLDADADILINTTRSMGVGPQAAGFPFKMMEYAATGRPIVSSEIGRLNDYYNSHITYYDGEAPESVAAAIEDVILNYDARVKMAMDLQKYVLSEFTILGTSRKLRTFLEDIKK